jgi:hypothetical protein
MKLALALGALAALASCDRPQDGRHDAVGRFQMLPSGNERHAVFVLDTVSGHIWLCDESPDASLGIKCGISQQTAQQGDDGVDAV